MNPAAILGLVSDLYSQVVSLTEHNQRLQQELQELRVAQQSSKQGSADSPDAS